MKYIKLQLSVKCKLIFLISGILKKKTNNIKHICCLKLLYLHLLGITTPLLINTYPLLLTVIYFSSNIFIFHNSLKTSVSHWIQVFDMWQLHLMDDSPDQYRWQTWWCWLWRWRGPHSACFPEWWRYSWGGWRWACCRWHQTQRWWPVWWQWCSHSSHPTSPPPPL